MQYNKIFKLLFCFVIAIVVVIAVLNFIFGLIVHFFDHDQSIWWHSLSPVVILFIFSLVFLSALFKYLIYKRGGQAIAQHLKAIPLEWIEGTPEEVLALKLNEELAGEYHVLPAHLYVLNEECGINAITVGNSAQDVCIILTWGALQSMNQHELKGVLAHEYCHIMTGKYIEHTHLEVLLSGFLMIGQLGSHLIVKGTQRKSLLIESIFSAIYVALGGFIWLLGSLGVLVSRVLKFLIFYHQKHDTDLHVLDFIDQQYLLHALMRIYVHDMGSHLYRVDSESLAHYCFANALSEQSWFKVHPSLSRRISYLHPNFQRPSILAKEGSGKSWQSVLTKILLPTNEEDLLDYLDAQQTQPMQPLPLLRLSPISFATKDAVRPLSPEIRQNMERPELLQRAMQTATGSREVLIAIFMIRQYREFIPDDAQVSKAIVDTLLKLDGRVHLQIFHEALHNIDNMPTLIARQFLNRITQIIQADGEIGLLDCLLLDRVKSSQGLLDDASPVSLKQSHQAIVHLIDALLHVQQINTQSQLYIRQKVLKRLLDQDQLKYYQQVTDQPLDLAYSLKMLSGLLVRERLYILSVAEHSFWSDRVITQDELDVLELLYWRFGFETDEVVHDMLKQSSLLIL